MHTSPSTQSTHTHNSIRNYILRYSFEIDVRLSATQLCLSDCNLIISITALAFKYTRTQTNAVFVFFFFCFNLCLALALTHLHHQLLLSAESEKKKRRAFFSSFSLFLQSMNAFYCLRWICNCGWSCWGSLIVSSHTLSICFLLYYLHTIISWSSVRPTKEIKTNIKIETI